MSEHRGTYEDAVTLANRSVYDRLRLSAQFTADTLANCERPELYATGEAITALFDTIRDGAVMGTRIAYVGVPGDYGTDTAYKATAHEVSTPVLSRPAQAALVQLQLKVTNPNSGDYAVLYSLARTLIERQRWAAEQLGKPWWKRIFG